MPPSSSTSATSRGEQPAESSAWRGRIRLYAASAANEFMLDIARTFAVGLCEGGYDATLCVDEIPSAEAGEGTLEIVVAPHEYFPLFLDRQPLTGVERQALRDAYLLNVEQPGTPWFELAHRHIRQSRGALDISTTGCAELRRRGVDVWHAPLGYVEQMEAQSPPPSRSVDVSFLGYLSPRRERFFARHATTFADFGAHLALARGDRPLRLGEAGYLAEEARKTLFASSRITVNVHARDQPYFEAQRILYALANGCLVISEPMSLPPPLVDSEHLRLAPLEEIAQLCRYYLEHEEERDVIAEAGRTVVRDHYRMSTLCKAWLRALRAREAAAGRRSTPRRSCKETTDRSRGAVTETNGAYTNQQRPAVSVVITNHNYASYIEGCVESVCRSNATDLPGGVELVVVDDASTDDSLARIRRQMATLGWPLLLAAKPERTGPGDSRNIGLARARAAYAFMLDADNEVSPHCLARLYRALHGGHHAASYGICAKVDGVTDEARGLLSPYAWSVERLVRGPYIDGMALFDRETLLSLGGYAADLVEGWEDYDLWLRLAEAGHSALHVPQIVARYRTHRFGSVSHRAARHHPELHRHFNDRFAALARRFPEAGERFGFPCRQLPVARKAYAAYRRLRDALARFGS